MTSLTAPGSKTWTFGYNALGQRVSQTMPNGMVTEYDYDTRNRLESILHLAEAAGASVEEFAYTLDDAGNIERIDHLDGSYWEYEYDNRYRLTSAVRSNANGTIKANYSYTYNGADYMTAKTEPFLDDFNDGTCTGWGVWGGSWDASGFYTECLSTDGTADRLVKAHTDGDFELEFSYAPLDSNTTLYARLRIGWTDGPVDLRIGPVFLCGWMMTARSWRITAARGTGRTRGTMSG